MRRRRRKLGDPFILLKTIQGGNKREKGSNGFVKEGIDYKKEGTQEHS